MKGTEKQIAWANDIRSNILDTCDANIARFRESIPEYATVFSAIRDKCVALLSIIEKNPQAEDASFWIENRDRLPNPVRISEQVSLMMSNGKSLNEALKTIFGF